MEQKQFSTLIRTGCTLGTGSYCVVKELIIEMPNNHADDDVSERDRDMTETTTKYLALKQPRKDIDPEREEKARKDLVKEIQILSSLKHDNIVNSWW